MPQAIKPIIPVEVITGDHIREAFGLLSAPTLYAATHPSTRGKDIRVYTTATGRGYVARRERDGWFCWALREPNATAAAFAAFNRIPVLADKPPAALSKTITINVYSTEGARVSWTLEAGGELLSVGEAETVAEAFDDAVNDLAGMCPEHPYTQSLLSRRDKH